MKKYLFLLMFYTIPSYAMPPYFGISVGTNLSFQNSTCVTAAKKTLSKNGFKNVVQYKNSFTVFAAYRKTNPYQYKALVKCLADSGVLIVVAAADIPKNAKNKADTLRQKIQQYNGINLSSASIKSVYNRQAVIGTSNVKGNTSADWDNSLMGKKECMANAERSLRRSGFYKNLNYDENSVYANNKHNYKAVIRCLTDNKEIYYEVTGGTKSTRDNLVEDLKKDFY
ncbi:MAG TPA: hypothetical protein ENK59_06405 [Thioploca sp.]|nr:hypothetical protein [Thioploca sp.]